MTAAGHDALAEKVRDIDWAKSRYDKLKARVDAIMQQANDDPEWLSSRLAMNWQTHYTTPVCEKSRYVGGEGHAPVPTPRFAGARDWATSYSTPADIASFVVHDDDEKGRIKLHNHETDQDEWVEPAVTGRAIESINQQIMQVAADAGFVYFITGDERYARFASSAIWTYMQGFAYVTPPKLPPGDESMRGIIGSTSFEVIHEDVVTPIAISYDFCHDELVHEGKDVSVIQQGLKRMIDRVIDGGSREGNWNLNQARIITYGALALEDNDAYADHRGRPFYVDLVLNADLPHQLGITKVLHHAFDAETAMWPEAPGYGFGAAKDITLIASLLAQEPAGAALLRDPILSRNLIAQANLTYPSGLAVGLGDTTDTRVNTEQLELLIASARAAGDAAAEDRLTSLLDREIASGDYNRSAGGDDLVAMAKYVDVLKPVPATGPSPLFATFFGKPLNVFIQRNPGNDPATSLAAAMYGTKGGHIHANGLAIELYGAGMTLGADPGRGDSYWTANHREYYEQPPAHNTVIVNARSNYSVTPADQIPMQLEEAEPASGQPPLSPDVTYATASFTYSKPVAADQQRTLAVIRTGKEAGIYVDVFRSRARSPENGEFHDYLYHDLGQSLRVTGAGNADTLPLTPSNQLAPRDGDLVGYGYFKNERSGPCPDGFHARFNLQLAKIAPLMDLWMPAQANRTLFAVDAPADHEIRSGGAEQLSKIPMPTILVRQQGESWDRPFIAVYQPSLSTDRSTIDSVRLVQTAANQSADDAGLAACIVEEKTRGSTIYLMQDDRPQRIHHHVSNYDFSGGFGVVVEADGKIAELYLGGGQTVGNSHLRIDAAAGVPVDAAVFRVGEDWHYSSSGPIRVRSEQMATAVLPAARDQPLHFVSAP